MLITAHRSLAGLYKFSEPKGSVWRQLSDKIILQHYHYARYCNWLMLLKKFQGKLTWVITSS
jgi:hypothetical protein